MKKLYENFSYQKTCAAVVTDSFEENGRYYVKLSESILFPEEGGQYADTGRLTGDESFTVLDGQIKGNEIIYEVSGYLSAGSHVEVCLDWEKRYMRMQQHSAEHIMCGIISAKYGFDNVGFHLSDDDFVTMDINGQISAEEIYEVERQANIIVSANQKITAIYPESGELESISYRSKKKIDGQVRLIVIGEGEAITDICACCAPHVERTGEIGMILVCGIQNYKGGMRISLLAGDRAVLYMRKQLSELDKVARYLTTSSSNILDIVKKQKEETGLLKAENSVLKSEKLLMRIKENKDFNKCIFLDGDISQGALRKTLEAGMEFTRGILAVCQGEEEAYNYIICGKENSEAVHKKMKDELFAKGGGKEPMFSGRMPVKRQEIEIFFKEKLNDFSEEIK